jgi:hypothetical protein
MEISFKGNATLNIRQGGREIPKDNLVAVFLNKIEIDTENFISSDPLLFGEREGIVRMKLNGQETVVPFSGKGHVFPKYCDKIIYFGINPGQLSIQYELIELDDEVRKVIGTASKLSDALAKSPLAAHSPAIGPSIGLFGALLNYIKSQVDNDDESLTYMVCEKPLRNEDIIEIESSSTHGSKIKLEFEIVDFDAPKRFEKLGIRINNPKMYFIDKCYKREGKNYNAIEWLVEFKKLSVFNFQAASGKYSASLSTKLKHIENILAWEKFELFRMPAARGAGSRHYVPLSMNFSINQKDLNAEGILELVQKGLSLGEALGADVSTIADKIEKQGQTALSTISELSDNNFSMYSFDGIFILDKDSASVQRNFKGQIVIPWVDERKAWIATIENDLQWNGRDLGRISFEIEIKPI